MKYKIIVNNIDVEVSADQIKEIIKNNPELLKEEKGGRYFFPKEGDKYYTWYTHTNDLGVEIYHGSQDDLNTVNLGCCFKTEEQSILDADKSRAIVACWKWTQDNAPFEPDWGNVKQNKYYVYYHHGDKELNWTYDITLHPQFTLPYLKSRGDCESFTKANKEHLELLFTK